MERPKLTVEQAFGLALKKLRLDYKISQEELAYRSDLDRTSISSFERGKTSPKLNTVFVLAECFNLEPEQLIKLASDYYKKE
jgi:transcriptional regulator with XRE-family HTH domain